MTNNRVYSEIIRRGGNPYHVIEEAKEQLEYLIFVKEKLFGTTFIIVTSLLLNIIFLAHNRPSDKVVAFFMLILPAIMVVVARDAIKRYLESKRNVEELIENIKACEEFFNDIE